MPSVFEIPAIAITPALLQFIFGISLILFTAMSLVLTYHYVQFGRGAPIFYHLLYYAVSAMLLSFAASAAFF